MRRKIVAVLLSGVLCAGLVTGCGKTEDVQGSVPTETETQTESETLEDVAFEDIKELVSGIEDLKVWNVSVIVKNDTEESKEEADDKKVEATDNTKLIEALRNRIKVDKNIITDVDINADKVNLAEVGKYDVTYSIEAKEDLLSSYLKDKGAYDVVLMSLENDEGTDKDVQTDEGSVGEATLSIEVSYKCEVLDKEGVKKAIEDGEKNILGAIEDGKVTEAWKAVETKVEETEETKEEETPEVPEEVKPEEKPAEKPAEKPVKPAEPEKKPTPKPEEPKKEEPKHTHSYSVTKNASCGSNGVKSCSCGATQEIPATGHNWVNHKSEAKGHYEDVAVGTEEVIVGYDEKILYICKKCGYSTYSYSEFDAHAFENISHGGSIQRTEQTPIYETRTKYESQWVVDEPATSYTKCSVCGATK